MPHPPRCAVPATTFCATSWPFVVCRHGSKQFVTLALTAATAAVALLPEAAAGLQFDRRAVAAGQWWRVLSGHFVHWGGEHLIWDLAMFALLGTLCERRDRRRFLLVLFIAGLAVSAAVWTFAPNLQTYRGLSGVDTALFALLAVDILQDQWRARRWGSVLAIAALLAGLAAKTGFELGTGATVFVDARVARFEPVPVAHIAGAAVGAIVAAADKRNRWTSRAMSSRVESNAPAGRWARAPARELRRAKPSSICPRDSRFCPNEPPAGCARAG